MSVKDLIEKKKVESPTFAQEFEAEKQRLEIAVAVTELRSELGVSQREFAEKVGKPQSTITRIENGSMNPSIKFYMKLLQKLVRNCM